jgi:hypothetical protein
LTTTSHRARGALALASALVAATPALAIGDGARAYQLVPAGSNIASGYGIFLDGNSSLDPSTAASNASIAIDVAALQFTRQISVGGNASGLFAILPVGRVDGEAIVKRPLRPPVTLSGDSSGLGDIQLGAVIGLVGSPSLPIPQYVAFQPGFALGALARVTLPTGAYSADKAINLGANRWVVQVGAPMGYYLGTSMLDPALMTFELLPSVSFHGVNGDPFGADRQTQAPMFRLEAHVTRNLNRALWIGVDAIASSGGKTTTDGISDDNGKSSLELGGTVGLNLSKSFALKATYGGVVARNSNGLDGSGFRLVGTLIF